MSDGRRIVLSEDDFNDEPVAVRPSAPPPAEWLPPVARGVPLSVSPEAPTGPLPTFAPLTASTSASLVNNPVLGPLGIALIGMFVAWGLTELFGLPTLVNHATSKTGADADIGAWTAVLELLFVGVIVAGDRLLAGAFPEAMNRFVIAIVPAAIVGFIAGFAAQAVYAQLYENAIRHSDFSFTGPRYYLARAVGWAIFGLGAGLTVGIIDRSPKKALNGAVGGLAGGAVGGVVFQYLGLNVDSERFSRLCGLLAIAALVALATRAVEAARRDAWLRVTSGGMVGKEFILYHAVTRIGSAPSCEIFLLKDPAVESLHAQIEDRGRQRVLTSSPAAPAYVNNAAATNHVLRSGDMLRLGNTVLAYSERTAHRPM
jgi:hypothetical protein